MLLASHLIHYGKLYIFFLQNPRPNIQSKNVCFIYIEKFLSSYYVNLYLQITGVGKLGKVLCSEVCFHNWGNCNWPLVIMR